MELASIARFAALLTLGILAGGCSSFAPPAPWFTYGGTSTAGDGGSEVALGVGTGVVLFEGAHTGGSGWMGRYRYGLNDRTDFGVDFMGLERLDNGMFAVKLTTRRQLARHWQGEVGFGAADDSDGKSLAADLALTLASQRSAPWNFYASARLAGAKGFAGDVILGDNSLEEDQVAPPDALFALVNLGAEGRMSDTQRFIIEVGLGAVAPTGERSAGAFYFSAGMVSHFGAR